ncbi:hypothetical protein A6R68_06375, partial [Neotoma lepida]
MVSNKYEQLSSKALNGHLYLCQQIHEIHILKKWGFTKLNADGFEDILAEKQLFHHGCGVKYIPNGGTLDKWRDLHS